MTEQATAGLLIVAAGLDAMNAALRGPNQAPACDVLSYWSHCQRTREFSCSCEQRYELCSGRRVCPHTGKMCENDLVTLFREMV